MVGKEAGQERCVVRRKAPRRRRFRKNLWMASTFGKWIFLFSFSLERRYVNMINGSTAPEHIKVIISSLDYSTEGITRTILRKALTSSDEISRKWVTRYLSVLASVELPGFDDWGVQLMLRQLTDESPKVVRNALRLLNRWLPEYPSRKIRKIEWSLYGEAGEMLKPHLYSIEEEVILEIEEVRDLVKYWLNTWNTKFVDAIDEDLRTIMFSNKRSLDGSFSRSSTEKNTNGVPAPIHLFGALGKHETGRELLIEEHVCEEMLGILHNSNSKNRDIKGALWGLSSIASTDEGFSILPIETIPRIIKIAEEHGVLSIRGTAFLACVCISQSVEGAKRLAQFGWESNKYRYTIDIAKKMAQEEIPLKRRNTHNRHYSVVEKSVQEKPRAKSRTRSQSESRIDRAETNWSEKGNGGVGKIEQTKLRHWSSDLGLRDELAIFEDNQNGMILSPISIEVVDEYRMHSSSGANSRLSNERRRANTTNSNIEEDSSLGTRSSTVARCIREGLQIPREQLEAEGTLADTIKEFHFSCRMREKFHLAPFRIRASMQINRNIGDPIRYIFMSKDEERYFANFRRETVGDSWLFDELCKEDNSIKKTVSVVPLQTVALPAEVEVICANIFPSKSRSDTIFTNNNNDDIEDRGARGGYAKNDNLSHIQRHSKYRCFHCTEDVQTEYPHPDAVQLRREVLNQVDMLEIKEYPTKRLIGLRQHNEWLFKWPCLYADVLELLDEYRFKPHSRAFLQQIFYDALQF
ncbi:unnamed protein product [Caenorhabditis angaria]|uniref:Rapamycin-insensitive companion of mTOR domain-containing protein n=1 Tax=Caenorhabditis angaria TaxID=860376 RepID=A0A9P1I889_9PELO|nr:unnamed protein product [Caenorhabditis angaria]